MGGGISLAPLITQIKVNISGFRNEMEKAKTIGVAKARELSKSFDSAINTGTKLRSIGDVLTKHVTLPIVAAGIAGTKFSMDLSQNMGRVATLLDGTSRQVREKIANYRKDVYQISNDTGVSTQNIAGGLYEVISAYGETADSAKILDIAVKGSMTTGAETADVVKLLSAVTKGYGDTTAKANQKVSDMAFLTEKLGQTTVPELASSIGKVTPLAATLGVTQSELFGVMATGTGVTGDAAEVTTQFRGILQSLLSPTKDMTSLMKKLGYRNGQAMLKSLGLQKTIDKITGAAKKSNKPLQNYISSIEGQTLALTLSGKQHDVLTKKIDAMKHSAGESQKALKAMFDNNPGLRFKLSLNKIKNVLTKMGDVIAPILDDMASGIDKITTAFDKLSEPQQKMIVGILATSAAMGPATKMIGSCLIGYGKLGKGITKVGKLFVKNEKGISKFGIALTKSKSFAGTFGKGLKMIIDPLNLSGKAMNVTGKGATKFGKVLLKLKTPIKAVGSHLSFLKVPFTMTGKLFGKFGALAGKTGGKVVQVFGKMASLVPGPVQKMGGLVAKSMGKLGGTVVGKMGKIAGSMIGGFARCGASLVGFLGPVGVVIAIVGLLALAFATNFGGCRNTVKNVMTSIKSIISSVTAIIQVIWSNWGIYIKTFALAIWNNIQVIFSTALKVIADVFKVFASIFKGDWQGAWNAVKDIFSSIWNMIGSLLKNFLNIVIMIIVGIGGKLLNAARTAFMGIMHGFKYVWAAITGWLSGAVHHPVDTIRGIGSALYSAGCSIFNSLWNGIKSVWSGITSWVSDKISWLKSKVEFWKSSNDSMKKTDGSHYNGLSYVPWDGYVARLHKGERILTADENSAYTHGGKGNGEINVQNNFYGRVDSPYEVYKATRKSMRDWQFA